MAIDEALLRSFDPAASLPVLRLYGWNPPALSLGRFQRAAEVLDLQRCRADGVAVVRRVTGGGVIYHADELTYSLVCAPGQVPPTASIKDSFRVLTGFLLAFYQRLGIDAAYATDVVPAGQKLGERTAFCFAGRESFDILAGGRKIGGNAQRRMRGKVFQHGSIPLRNCSETGLRYMLDRSPEQIGGVVSLFECGVQYDANSLANMLRQAFSDYLEVTFDESALTSFEEADAEHLLTARYLNNEWNLEGVAE